MVAGELRATGHAVRGTTRDTDATAAIEAAGAEAFIGDPDRIGTIAPALEHVTVVCLFLGSAAGAPEAVAALHGPRLEMLLARVIDSPARGFVYEAAGSAGSAVLQRGAAIVRQTCERSRLPHAVLEADPDQHASWVTAATAAVDHVLSNAFELDRS